MEENTKQVDFKAADKQPAPLTVEQLKQKLDAAIKDNQYLVQRINKAEEYIAASNTQNLFTYISFLFKVMEHAEMYDADFVANCVSDIQELMGRLHAITVSDDYDGNGEQGASQAE